MPKTFQRKIILYNMLIIICIASAVSFYNYNSYRKNVIAGETKNSLNRLVSLSDRLEMSYDEMINILLNCTERKTLFVTTSFSEYREGYDNPRASIYAANVLKDLCAISGYSDDIYKLTLYNDGFLVQAGSSFGASDDPERIMASPWFQELMEKETSQYTLTLADNPFSTGAVKTPKILPLIRPLPHISGHSEDYWVFLGISPSLFQKALQTMPEECNICIATATGDVIAYRGEENDKNKDIMDRLLAASSDKGSFKLQLDRGQCVVTFKKQPISGILVYEVIPVASMNPDHDVLYNTVFLVFLFCIIIGLILSFVISRQLGAPINRLTRRLHLIADGDFTPDLSIETNDEIGMIGKQINQMSSHISALLDSRVQNEKEKKNMEIKMLQAQINPHFLYNTLDSIKWIATMQKNTGIIQVVTALSSLLKNMAKGFNEKVTFQQELDFLENYVTIEKIRYVELFDVDIQVDDPNLYDARIIKLTLQPIVENSIFNGIEPSGCFGLITIHAYAEHGIFYVTVRDNGIGIAPENIEKLLTDTSRVTRSGMSGIGLPNVDRRLKLVYGEDYGITIESELDTYTMITVSLPLEYE